MGMMGSRLRTGWVLAVIGALALVGACSLNPQPIPPGETDGTERNDASTPTNSATGGSDGGGDGKGTDAASPPQTDDAGDASDSGDEDAADSGDT
jgi:hypothetical protein